MITAVHNSAFRIQIEMASDSRINKQNLVHGSQWKKHSHLVASNFDSSRHPGSILGMGSFMPELMF